MTIIIKKMQFLLKIKLFCINLQTWVILVLSLLVRGPVSRFWNPFGPLGS